MAASTLRQLAVFKAVVDSGSFSAAAEALSISQPSVSEHIRALEAHFRQALLDRKRGRAPTVTEAGRKIYDYAGSVLNQSLRVNLDLEEEREARNRTLVFAAHMFVADKLLPPVLSDFTKRWPSAELVAHVGRSDEVARMVRAKEVDLGLVLSREGEVIAELRAEVIGRQDLIVIAAPNHPLARLKRVPISRLGEFPFMMPERGTEYHRRITSMLSDLGISNVKTSIQTPHMRNWYGLVKTSNSLCVAIRNRVADELARGELVAIDAEMPPLRFDVQVIWLDEWAISESARRFLAVLRKVREADGFIG